MKWEEAIARLRTSVSWWEDRSSSHAGSILSCLHNEVEAACNSEIEKVFLIAWLMRREWDEFAGSSHGGKAKYGFHRGGLLDITAVLPSEPDVFQFDLIESQVPLKGYVADFVLRRAVRRGYDEPFDFSPSVIIECDGHDFHERTKEQAAHDKERDRVLQTAGFYVMRFTGSEIWRDASACTEEVELLIDTHMNKAFCESRTRRKVDSNAPA